MRRLLLVPVLAAALVVSACSSSTGAPQTVTVKRTVTSGQQTPDPSGSAQSSVVVVPNGSAETTPSAPASTTPSASSATSVSSSAPVVTVDPLKSDCSILLSPSDVKKALAIDIPTGSFRIKDVADPARGVVGKVRCRYGSADNGKTGKVGVLLTQFKDVASADKQIAASRTAEQDNGSTVSDVTVKDNPAVLMVGKGGEIVLRYDKWTLSVSTRDGVAPAAKLTTGLPVLAEQVLSRILKNG